jgi:hypothetical protein
LYSELHNERIQRKWFGNCFGGKYRDDDIDTEIDTEIDSIVRRRQIRILIWMEMEIATCSDIDTELETNMERVAINDYFRGVDANTLSSLHDTQPITWKNENL